MSNAVPWLNGKFGATQSGAGVYAWHSTDGQHWNYRGTVATTDQFPTSGEGPNENDVVLLADGRTLMVVFRIDDGVDGGKVEAKNYQAATSTNGGKTWTTPWEMVDVNGRGIGVARPRLLMLGGEGGGEWRGREYRPSWRWGRTITPPQNQHISQWERTFAAQRWSAIHRTYARHSPVGVLGWDGSSLGRIFHQLRAQSFGLTRLASLFSRRQCNHWQGHHIIHVIASGWCKWGESGADLQRRHWDVRHDHLCDGFAH